MPFWLFGATWDQLPLAYGLDEVDRAVVEKDFAALHPWKSGDALPVNFKEVGLESPVKLVACDMYLDGASRYYLFRGANGKFLVLCTDTSMYQSSDKKIIQVDKPRLYLGVWHFSDKNKVLVPLDSPTEKFLLEAIKGEVDRYNLASKETNTKPSHTSEPARQPETVQPKAQ